MSTSPKPVPAFLADITVVRLGRWMRLLGYDVDISNLSARELANKKEPETTARILLGRCPGRSGAPSPAPHEGFVHIKSEHLREQIKQVAKIWPMPFRETFLTRCEDCNHKLEPPHQWAELPDDIASKVPPRVRDRLDEYRYCNACRKPYWNGTHVERMRHYLEEIIPVF